MIGIWVLETVYCNRLENSSSILGRDAESTPILMLSTENFSWLEYTGKSFLSGLLYISRGFMISFFSLFYAF